MATPKKPASKATKNTKASGSGAKKAPAATKKAASKKPVAKKAVAKPAKKAAAPVRASGGKKVAVPAKSAKAPVKKAPVAAKKASSSKPTKSVKPAQKVQKAAGGKKTTVGKKKAPIVKAPVNNNKKTVNKKTTTKTVSAKSAPAKKSAPVKKAAATPVKKTVSKPAPVAKKAAAPAKPVKKAAPAPVAAKKVEPAKKAAVPVKPEVKKPQSKAAAKAHAKAVAKVTPPKPATVGLNKLPVKSANSTVPSPAARPAITRSAIREEKKPNVIIAHRRLENKSRKSDDSGKTMINYQPDYTRSILDQPVEQQGPVYRYSDEELNEFRELINSRLEAARKELNYLQGLITRKDEAGTEDTENRYMNMEDGSGAMEREQLAQLASRQIQFVTHLEKALMRIENKTYGICRVTGKLIDKARLRAVPHATLSIEAKNTMTKK